MIKSTITSLVFLFLVSSVFAAPGIFDDEKIKRFCNEYPKDEICIKLNRLDKDDPKYLERKQEILNSLSKRTDDVRKEFKSIQSVLEQVEEQKSTEIQ